MEVSFDLTYDRRKAMVLDLPDILSPISRFEWSLNIDTYY